ncbi:MULTISPECIES: DUF2635 domain-containing protein [Enterobacteriaceae]|uniref:DUF2635 domain-containing protein n=1 Tax=Enterobacteriaceae TaxID=543 RepID=UPI001C7DE116|nr:MULTISPECIES: DUF2635 domain-containing protein [Enterobacteriaceae]ELW9327602.1 DUF2635 domain-containing protein [Citrobacter freundii]ELW9351801.1 DUF2635 domain-containing protein [Citrobacter freundii]EMF0719783.1 DUF2635 domain-containing protein [Citrobacter freundii]MCR3700823.1 DUF2635 domain-containing protein [Citrobacter portucalensis]CAF9714864.1 hypothetical protein AI3059V2_4209 [Citrobacter freundii]
MNHLIKPAREGLRVRKSNGEHLKPEGENLPMSAWWHRRQAEGDVTVTDIAEPVTAETQKHKTGEK